MDDGSGRGGVGGCGSCCFVMCPPSTATAADGGDDVPWIVTN